MPVGATEVVRRISMAPSPLRAPARGTVNPNGLASRPSKVIAVAAVIDTFGSAITATSYPHHGLPAGA